MTIEKPESLDDHQPYPVNSPVAEKGKRDFYAPPQLTLHGRLSNLTLGGSPGVGDSGEDTTHYPPGGGP